VLVLDRDRDLTGIFSRCDCSEFVELAIILTSNNLKRYKGALVRMSNYIPMIFRNGVKYIQKDSRQLRVLSGWDTVIFCDWRRDRE